MAEVTNCIRRDQPTIEGFKPRSNFHWSLSDIETGVDAGWIAVGCQPEKPETTEPVDSDIDRLIIVAESQELAAWLSAAGALYAGVTFAGISTGGLYEVAIDYHVSERHAVLASEVCV